MNYSVQDSHGYVSHIRDAQELFCISENLIRVEVRLNIVDHCFRTIFWRDAT